jgi:hypothetical protein
MRRPIVVIELPPKIQRSQLAEIHHGLAEHPMSREYFFLVVVSDVSSMKIGILGFNWFAAQFMFRKVIRSIKDFANGIIGKQAKGPAEVQPGQENGPIPGPTELGG